MKLELHKKQNSTAVKDLYYRAFPQEERLPFFIIRIFEIFNKVEIIDIIDDSKFVGFMVVLSDENIVFLQYFAVDESLRGKGIGSIALDLLKDRYKHKTIILDIEKPNPCVKNNKQRISRKNFYLKNGYVTEDFIVKNYGVTYEIMSTNGRISLNQYKKLIEKTYGKLLMKNVMHFSVEWYFQNLVGKFKIPICSGVFLYYKSMSNQQLA